MIKESIDSMRISFNKFPKLKGHLKIRLHNPNTWKTEIIESENMVTNAVRDIMSSNLCGVLNYTDLTPLFEKLFGGVICFGGQSGLDVSSEFAADDYFIPEDDSYPVIAHAGQTSWTSQDDDVKRGNPLANAMQIADGAVTLAWEWGGSAGIGVIKSLGLTHSDVGDAGTGSTSNAFKQMVPFIPSTNSTLTFSRGNAGWGGVNASDYNIPAFVIDEHGFYFKTTNATKKLTIIRYPVVYTKAGIASPLMKGDPGIFDSKEITLSIGANFNGLAPAFWFDEVNRKLWIFYNTSASATVYCEEINLSNWESITHTNHDFTLSDAVVGPFANYVPLQITVYNGYAYLPRYDNKNFVYKVRLASVADTSVLSMASNNQYKWCSAFTPDASKINGNNKGRILASTNYVINNGTVYECNSGNVGGGYVGSGTYRYSMPFTEIRSGLSRLGGAFDYNLTRPFAVCISKFYLATKCNLPTPVEKTASQNMNITYTLTEVEEES